MKGTIEEWDLPKNTMSSKKYKIAIDESVETAEKTKTTIKQHSDVLPRRSDAP